MPTITAKLLPKPSRVQRQVSKFRSWIFSDAERTERLVRTYNDLYNNLRPRLFDGAHLTFPGMNQNVRLNPHQKDAVWRGMSAGNTLLGHVVGAGIMPTPVLCRVVKRTPQNSADEINLDAA